MTSFLNAGSHSSLLVLFFGFATFAGCMGMGFLVLRLLRTKLPAAFAPVVAVLVGIQVDSLAVQATAMAQASTPAVLVAIWCASFALGAIGLALFRPQPTGGDRPPVPWGAIAIVVIASSANLVAAVVPSSKIDELYYHMLVPARIVSDHGLRFYRAPIEAAVLPNMAFQIFAAPLHALGYPDAPNVVSWLLGLMLVWLGWTLLRERKVTGVAAYCLVAAITVGGYAITCQVGGSSYAFGDLSLGTAVAALATADAFIAASSPAAFALAISVLAWSSASSKVLLLPLAFAVLVLGGCVAWRAARYDGSRPRVIAGLAAPWLLLGSPMMAWTWIHSGSPFGPALAGYFGGSAYDLQALKSLFDDVWQDNHTYEALAETLLYTGIGYSPLIWIGMLGALVSKQVPARVRRWGSALLLGQAAVIACLLPYYVRYLGGLHYGLVVCFALYCAPPAARWNRAVMLAIALGLVPWIAGQIYYGQQFAKMAFGFEDRTAFYRRYVAFYDDFVRLDRLLPENAVLLATDFIVPAVYSPRPVVYDPADLPPGRVVYLFGSSEPGPSDVPAGYVPDGEVYYNPEARELVFRREWVPPVFSPLRVVRLARKDRPGP